MNIIRPVRLEDEEKIVELVAKSGLGIISLPHDPKLLHKKIIDSIEAFKDGSIGINRKFFFVLENSGRIGGCSAIYAKTGIDEPDDYYEVQFEHVIDPVTQEPNELKMLKRTKPYAGPSMLCSLFVAPEFRKGSLGRLLSISRLMFMARFPNLFTKTVIANLRGFVENNRSPFWESVGRHFFNMDYEVFLKMQESDKKTIPDFIPHTPIYISLLPPEAQEVIGKSHPNSLPALKMLEGEGFTCEHFDLYDAGPIVSTELTNVRTVKQRQTAIVGKIASPENTAETWILSNSSFDFRACYGHLDQYAKDLVCIDDTVASSLNINVGDIIHYVSIH
ncbi:MAG: arginine N-succinyltransferase [Parachlamydiaceae bacterium]|nr:arginine N-succinyltransferase [Parachlamydiaceae bacterium]